MRVKQKRRQLNLVRAAVEQCEKRMMLSSGASGGVSLTTDPTGVSSQLLAVAQGQTSAIDPYLMYDSSGRVEVKITAVDVNALAAPLAAIGFVQTGAEPDQHYVEGFIPPAALTTIDSLTSNGLMGVLPTLKPQTSAGKVDSEGDPVLEADRTRAATGITGAGVTVGVLSDSYNNQGDAAADVASGDLPGNVNVLQDYSSGGTDEGRAMLQIVHDLAPGASLAFATADFGEAAFAQNILNLAKPVASGGAGANIINDDVVYYDEPVFQDGTIANAINTVVTNSNVSYFSAAGNDDTQAYDSANVNFYSSTIIGINSSAQQYYNYNPTGTAANMQSLTLLSGQSLSLGLQWDQPYYTTTGVTTQLNMFLLSTAGAVVASATTNVIANQEPFQFLNYTNSGGSSVNYSLVIEKVSGPTPGRINYQNFGDGDDVTFNNYATNSATITPHSAAVNAFSVAAAPAYSQRTTEPYTSEGPSTILFNSSGGRLSSPQIRAKPDATAIDGVSTTFFGQADYGNGFDQFFGTSAATPHAAAVAALIKAANPSFTPAQIYSALKSSADPAIGTGNANFIGAGLIDAYRAVVGSAVPAVATVNDGFESGYLGQDWTTYNLLAGETEVSSANSPASGTYQLTESGDINATATNSYDPFPVLAQAILNLNVPSYATNLVLSFSQKKFFNSSFSADLLDYPMPATFTGNGDYDGVAVSVDGTHWYSLISLTGANSTTSYQSHSINLSQIAAADGLTLGATTQIKFQYYDAASFLPPNGGFAFDSVAVSSGIVLTGSQYDLKLDPDGIHLDIYNSNTSTGALYAQVLAAQVTNITVAGTGSPESLTVDFSNGSPFTIGLAYNASGTASSNSLLAIGTTAGNDTVTASSGAITVNGITLTGTDIGTLSFAPGAGTDALTVNSGTLNLSQRSGSGIITDLFSAVTVAGTAKLAVAPPTTHATRTLVDTTTLTIAGVTGHWTGTLDLNGSDLTVTSGSLATVNNQVTSGFASGSWTGTGIDSSAAAANTGHLTALGTILNTINGTQPLYGSGTGIVTFDGASPGPSAILVKFTYYGDATLDGKTDASDYSRMDAAFLTDKSTPGALTGWFNGDFNYDTVINGTDYTLADNTFNRQGATLASQVAAPAVKQARATAIPSLPTQPSVSTSLFSDVSLSDQHHRVAVEAGLVTQ